MYSYVQFLFENVCFYVYNYFISKGVVSPPMLLVAVRREEKVLITTWSLPQRGTTC